MSDDYKPSYDRHGIMEAPDPALWEKGVCTRYPGSTYGCGCPKCHREMLEHLDRELGTPAPAAMELEPCNCTCPQCDHWLHATTREEDVAAARDEERSRVIKSLHDGVDVFDFRMMDTEQTTFLKKEIQRAIRRWAYRQEGVDLTSLTDDDARA